MLITINGIWPLLNKHFECMLHDFPMNPKSRHFVRLIRMGPCVSMCVALLHDIPPLTKIVISFDDIYTGATSGLLTEKKIDSDT